MGHVASIPTSNAFVPLNARDDVPPYDSEDVVHVLVPPTRPDILHECDIMEDVAVAYGFNNLKRTFPATNTVARPYPINKLSDLVRRLCAESGWLEVLPLTLCSHDENFAFLNRKDTGQTAVVLANPKTIEYQVVRTSLLPGILKTIRENRKHSLPLRVFEVSDVVLKDGKEERQARNVRRVGAVFCGRKAGFEIVHGLLGRLMVGLGVENLSDEKKRNERGEGYYIRETDDPTYFAGRGAKIFYRPPTVAGAHTTFAPVASADESNAIAERTTVPPVDVDEKAKKEESHSTLDNIKEKLEAALPRLGSVGQEQDQHQKKEDKKEIGSRDIEIGSLGILHPSVLKRFELDYPCSALEFDVEPFL